MTNTTTELHSSHHHLEEPVTPLTYIVLCVLDNQQHGAVNVLHKTVNRLQTEAVLLRAVNHSPGIPNRAGW